MTNTYTAITIGPIIDTLDATRKTRELWGGSYLFSYIIREIVLKLNKSDVLLPYFEDETEWQNYHGAGLFPDKIIVKGEVNIIDTFYAVLDDLSKKIEDWLKEKRKAKRKLKADEINTYLQKYLRFIQVHFECNDDENIIDKSTQLLDAKELQTKIIPIDEFVAKENPLFYFLYHVNESFLFDDGFNTYRPKELTKRRRFPSLIEIALKEFETAATSDYEKIEKKVEEVHEKFADLNDEKGQKKDETDILEFAEDLFPNSIRQPHKYIAIIQADGDKIGKLVAKVGNDPAQIQQFSKKLLEFSKKATDVAVSFGGSPVYMGGDDLFFFAPLIYNKENNKVTFFDLIDALDKEFQNIVCEYAKNELKLSNNDLPSMSFGVSLSFYKFPLYEAKKMAFSALFEDIKWSNKRNAIKLKFRKHSGQLIEMFIDKSKPDLWSNTLHFINTNLQEDATFLNSFTHKLHLQDKVLFEKLADNNQKLKAFVKNNNNENYKQHKPFFKSLIQFVHVIHNNHTNQTEMKNYLYSTLRFIHFLRS